MPTKITIDTVGEVAQLTFVDRLGEPTIAPLSSDGVKPVQVAYTSDNTAVATVDPSTGVLTAVGAGTVNVGADVTDAATGAEALEPDGVTPFTPSPINVVVDPGAAVGDKFTVSAPAPAPAPAPPVVPPASAPAPDVPPAPAPDVPPAPPVAPPAGP